jgi:hypothetical protein
MNIVGGYMSESSNSCPKIWKTIALICIPLLITLAGTVYAITVSDIAKNFDSHELRIQELEKQSAIRNEQYLAIIKQLDRIEKKVDQ